jgi:putative salt-induced outer membrane protein YdiY
MTTNITHSFFSVLLLSSIAMADVPEDKKIALTDVEAQYSAKSKADAADDLKQSINFGFANTTGNADTLNINGKYVMSFTTEGYNAKALKIAFDAGAFVTENNDVKDYEEYTANLGLEQYIADGWLGYGAVNWLSNKFLNYDSKLSLGAGIGKEIFNDGQHTLKVKVGVAYNIEDFSDEQDTRKFASLNEYFEYNNKLNAVSSLYAKLGAMQNFENFSNDYEFLGALGFNFSVAENISVTIEEEVRYDALPAVGFQKTDTKSIIRVGYKF